MLNLQTPKILQTNRGNGIAPLSLAALGIVFGDIGTSPIYAFRQSIHEENSVLYTESNILGVLSLIFWALVIVISIKYLIFMLQADNEGEGGILALLALLRPWGKISHPSRKILMALGLFGAALLYGDGMITPAISVLSAIEGLGLVAPALKRETLIPMATGGMAVWRKVLFALIARNAARATAFYSIPPERVMEIGIQVEL